MGKHKKEPEKTTRFTQIRQKTTKIVLRSTLVMILFALTASLVSGWYFIKEVQASDTPTLPTASEESSPIEIVAVDNKTVLATIHPQDTPRKIVNPRDISPFMKQALVSAEDGTFYENPGFAPKRILAAALGHASGDSQAGGGSTITQQYVKNTLVGDEYSLTRKWKEILAATKMTAVWDKDDIITAYLNTIYFGRGAQGIENAALAYFNKKASELNESESILLAGIIQSPSRWDPEINPEGSKVRFDYVKNEMVKHEYLDKETADKLTLPETVPPKPLSKSTGVTDSNGHIVTMVFDELESRGFTKEQLFESGARIVTTIDPVVLDVMNRESRAIAEANGVRVGTAAVHPATGAISGVYGGDDGIGFNYATNPQMTGSTFKVFTLAAALENGITLNTPISSAPYPVENIVVQNAGGDCGICSVAEATKQSLNTSFYRIQDMLPEGPVTTQKMAHRLGVKSPLAESDGSVNRGITLGLYGTSPLEETHAFSTIANGGMKNDLHIVWQIFTKHDKLMYSHINKPERAVSQWVSSQVDAALEPVAAYSNGNQLGGGKVGYLKTGTVQLGNTGANRDALAAGYTRNLAVTAWVGTDNGSPLVDAYGNQVWGAGLPTTLWNRILNQVG